MKYKKLWLGAVLLLSVFVLPGCGLLSAEPTQAIPSATALPTYTSVPTNAPLPTATALPTFTPLPADTPVPASTPAETEPVRIAFAPGSIFAQQSGSLSASGRDRYVLRAAADQVMTVNLRLTSGPEALLIIWGKDGTVFVTDHAVTTYWQGKLPLTQDYYITVVASPAGPVNYTLEVTIPPL
ncbi:MAG: hypothetical protein RBT34_13255 [Anaerolineaceae bacterium]|jgi:hypothetical protein|nr:hypothetical protein [Anaerolineaceae bacterium]